MKRVLLWVGGLLVLLVLCAVGLMMATFGGMQPLQDGAVLPGGTVVLKGGFSASYLVPAGDKQFVLIDCGDDPKAAGVLRALEARGVGKDAVRAIFLTHGHPDHTGGCHQFPNAEVMALPEDVALAAGSQRAKGPLTSHMNMPPEKRAQVTRTLKDGELVVLGPLKVKTFAVPGHTGGSAAFLAWDTLFLGDSASGGASGKLLPAPWAFSDDVAQNRHALEALAQRLQAEHVEVKEIAFGHSGPLPGMAALASFRAP